MIERAEGGVALWRAAGAAEGEGAGDRRRRGRRGRAGECQWLSSSGGWAAGLVSKWAGEREQERVEAVRGRRWVPARGGGLRAGGYLPFREVDRASAGGSTRQLSPAPVGALASPRSLGASGHRSLRQYSQWFSDPEHRLRGGQIPESTERTGQTTFRAARGCLGWRAASPRSSRE